MLQQRCWQSVLERVCERKKEWYDTERECYHHLKKVSKVEQLKITLQDYKNTAESQAQQ